MKIHGVIVLVTIAITGCATTAVRTNSATPVPVERLLAYQKNRPQDSATIITTRDKGIIGGGCFNALYINGDLAARIDKGETATFHVAPGEIVLRYGRDPQGRALCHVNQSNWTQHETIMRTNETKYFRLATDQNGRFIIERGEGVSR